jgi:hypothetical protein
VFGVARRGGFWAARRFTSGIFLELPDIAVLRLYGITYNLSPNVIAPELLNSGSSQFEEVVRTGGCGCLENLKFVVVNLPRAPVFPPRTFRTPGNHGRCERSLIN